ncbi:hypothetical protein MARI_04420 [Marinobacter sp. JH2]|nr:glycosyltransferase family 2 protein [Marinobacter sp. JH2]QBM16362.1 hypothetical protein MARI_04420 [Marinobacter sp. JH2]
MPLSRPDVSIIVPIYNAEDFLERCLFSLSCQFGVSLEIILVNDGSTDSSAALASKFLDDARFKYFLKKNGGAASARNFGIRVAAGRYLAFVDSDDVLSPRFSNLFVREADRTSADIVSGRKCSFTGEFYFREERVDFCEVSSLELIRNGFSACGRLFRRSLFENEEYLFPEGVWAEDNGYIPYLASRARSIIHTDSIFYGYRASVEGSTSTSLRCVLDTPKSMMYLFKICDEEALIVYTLFMSLASAICRTQNRDFKDRLSLKEFMSLEDTKSLLSLIRDIPFLKYSTNFSKLGLVEFLIFCLFLKGSHFSGVALFNIRRMKSFVSSFRRSI